MTDFHEAKRFAREAADLCEVIQRKLEWAGEDFPNYGDLDIVLPAGHWRNLLGALTTMATQAQSAVAAMDSLPET